MTYRTVSVNVSEIKTIQWNGKGITTGIFKVPVVGKHVVKGVNIVGDDQADRIAHGGKDKAIYCYPIDHYPYWKERFPDLEFGYGMFGENLTTEGILEENLYIGDKLHIGSTTLTVVQPRVPCYQLGIKFQTQTMVKMFYEVDKPGFYCRIDKEGELEANDEIHLEKNPEPLITIIDVYNIFRKNTTVEIIDKAIHEPNLPEWLRNRLKEVIQGLLNS